MQFEGFTSFDWFVLTVILLSMAMAFIRGFTTVALSLGAWVGAFLTTSFGFTFAQPYARDLISSAEFADFTALAVLFLGSLIIFKIIADKVGRAMREGPVGFLDRSMGALFGLMRGLLFVSALYIGMKSLLGKDMPDWITDAKTKPLIAWGADMVESLTDKALGTKDGAALGFDPEKEIQSIRDQLANLPDKIAQKKLEEKLRSLEEASDDDADKDEDGKRN